MKLSASIERLLQAVGRNPLPYLGVFAGLVILALVLGAGAITAVRHRLQDRKVEKLEQKSDAATEEKQTAQTAADEAAQERAIEDAIRERTIKPEIQRTTRNLEEARARTKGARNDYDQAKKNTLRDDADSRALHERNCSDLRELYPGESIPLCER